MTRHKIGLNPAGGLGERCELPHRGTKIDIGPPNLIGPPSLIGAHAGKSFFVR